MSFSLESDVTPTDEELVARVRAGDREAYGTLWQRHSSAALAVARQYQGIADPEDILQEAAKAVFSSILRGGGPFGAFRPYLKQSVRNTAVSISRRRREAPVGGLDDLAEHSSHMAYDENDNALERMITVRAFKALPARWQEVLWYTCVEGMPARDAASRLGLSPNATAALAKRAREGLRRSWLEAHLNDDRLSSVCRSVVHQLPAYERDALSPKNAAEVREHLSECLRCSIVAGELDKIAERLPVIVLPLALAGIDIFGHGPHILQGFIDSYTQHVGPDAAAQVAANAPVTPDATQAAAAQPAQAGQSSSTASSSSQTASVAQSVVGAQGLGTWVAGAAHAAVASGKAILISAAVVGGVTAGTVVAVHQLTKPTEPVVAQGNQTQDSGGGDSATSGGDDSTPPGDTTPVEPDTSEQGPTDLPSAVDPGIGEPLTVALEPKIVVAPPARRSTPTPTSSAPTTPTTPVTPTPTPTPTPVVVPTLDPLPPTDSDAAPVLTGTGIPGMTVELLSDDTVVGSAVVAADGRWSLTLPESVSDRPVSIRQVAADGRTSATTDLGTFTFGLPTIASVDVLPNGANHDVVVHISGRDGPVNVRLFGAMTTWNANGLIVGGTATVTFENSPIWPSTWLPFGRSVVVWYPERSSSDGTEMPITIP